LQLDVVLLVAELVVSTHDALGHLQATIQATALSEDGSKQSNMSEKLPCISPVMGGVQRDASKCSKKTYAPSALK
jgi:hypothetical protein